MPLTLDVGSVVVWPTGEAAMIVEETTIRPVPDRDPRVPGQPAWRFSNLDETFLQVGSGWVISKVYTETLEDFGGWFVVSG